MSKEIIINVDHVTKSYKLYKNHSDRVKEVLHPFRKRYHQIFNALHKVTFSVDKGETVGIIGRNGSGKSTLLQLICGILKPTGGTIQVNGRISAILELGAGFNPEFTGLENIFLNCAILGLSEDEIKARLDSIVTFADIGDYIEQPVKTYSSGMYVRLAFSIAINVEPDILIVDEALSVGDEAFQRKCFSKIHSIKEGGSTILFVSHAAGAIIELCDRAILIDSGEIISSGKPKKIITNYHKLIFSPENKRDEIKKRIQTYHIGINEDDSENNKEIKNKFPIKKDSYDDSLISKSVVFYEERGVFITNARIINKSSAKVNVINRGGEYFFCYDVHFTNDAYKVRFGMMIKTISGFELAGLVTHSFGQGYDFIESGTIVRQEFPFQALLVPGFYFLNCGVVGVENGSEIFLHRIVDAVMFKVVQEADLKVTGVADFGTKLPVSQFGREKMVASNQLNRLE